MGKEINQEKRVEKIKAKEKKRRRKIGKKKSTRLRAMYGLTRAGTCVNLRAHAHLRRGVRGP